GWFWAADKLWPAGSSGEQWLGLVLLEAQLHTGSEPDGKLDELFQPDGVLVCSEMQPDARI
ncbi:MAG: hypothetical protein ACRCX7_14145, partial [Cetobacterium sp.]|uniref:hypothetical protein n=1 Tax=Cetobacterium sp. TaxID=2071632 RepID=UPI003F4174C7